MIATSRKSVSRPAISRLFEFSRFQEQTIASAYEALIPVVARRQECRPHRRDDREASTNVHQSPRRSVTGA